MDGKPLALALVGIPSQMGQQQQQMGGQMGGGGNAGFTVTGVNQVPISGSACMKTRPAIASI